MSTPAIPADRLIHEEILPGGAMWSSALKRGTTLRLTDLEGGANVSALFFNRDNFLERYNLGDTLKAQHTAKLTKGFVLYSDMGRILCSIPADTCGWHDPIGGISNAEQVRKKYGDVRFGAEQNGFHRNGRDQFLIELGKWGLGRRDLSAGVNFFSKIGVDDAGKMHFVPGNSKAGDLVDLRAEMNVLVVLNTCPHPLDPAPAYAPKKIKLEVWRSELPGPDDLCRTSRPENGRGFILTEMLFR